MEATHFIEVYRAGSLSTSTFAGSCFKIEILDNVLEITSRLNYLETIAVWKIKAADTPIEVRLAKRLGHPNAFCSVEYFEKSHQLYQHYAPQLEELKRLAVKLISESHAKP